MKKKSKENNFKTIIKTVKAGGNSGRVYVPVDWIGSQVEIRKIEEDAPGEG